MKIYNYHPDYKIYLGESEADESPLEPGEYLIPAYATTEEPPQCSEGKIVVFVNDTWTLIDDHRGTYYSIETGAEFVNHDPFTLPENATKEQPPELIHNHKLKWDNGWSLEEFPAPMMPELTPQEKLAAAGLTVDELKELLGL